VTALIVVICAIALAELVLVVQVAVYWDQPARPLPPRRVRGVYRTVRPTALPSVHSRRWVRWQLDVRRPGAAVDRGGETVSAYTRRLHPIPLMGQPIPPAMLERLAPDAVLERIAAGLRTPTPTTVDCVLEGVAA
jgi:hypothetical protein